MDSITIRQAMAFHLPEKVPAEPGGWFFVEVPSETQATELACSLRYAGHQVRPPYQDDKQVPASRAGWWIVDYR